MESASVQTTKKKHIVWIDWARAFAIITVVICHATESTYSFTSKGIDGLGPLSQASAFSLLTIGRLGVPVFLFISGYLLLDRHYDRDACKKFWKTKWLPLFLVTELWLVIYNVFLCLHLERAFDLAFLIKNMLFLENVGMGHTWYLPMIIGLYLFIPYISNGLKTVGDKTLLVFPLGLAIVIFFGTPTASVISQCLGFGKLANMIEPGFSGGVYGCYMLLGYCFRKDAFKNISVPALAFIALSGLALTVFLQIYAYSCNVGYNVWYNNGALLIAGFAIFGLFSKGKNLKELEVVSALSYYSFPIYLVHFPIRLALAPYFLKWAPIVHLPHVIQDLSFAMILIVLSLAVCKLIATIPKIGPKLIYLR